MCSGQVDEFLHELDERKARAPNNFPSNTPRQEFAIIDENYLRAVTDVTRPKLERKGNAIVALERDMLLKCATCAAEACDKSRTLSLSPETQPSLMAMYEAFYHGVTVLQCLTLDFSILPTQSIRRAAMACSSTLSVYTRIYSATAPFLQLSEVLADDVLNHANSYSLTPISAEDEARLSRAKSTMQEATVSDPSHIRRIFWSYQASRNELGSTAQMSGEDPFGSRASLVNASSFNDQSGSDSSSLYGMMDPLWFIDNNFLANLE